MSDILSICTKRNDLNANEKAVDYFTHLGKLYNDCFPLKCKKMHNKTLNKQLITQDLQKLIKRKNRLYGRKLKSKSPENLEKYNQCKRDLNKKLYISKKLYLSDKLLNTSRNLKLKWDAIRLVINRQKIQSTYCPIDNKLLGTHYSSVAEKLNSKLKNINENEIPATSTTLDRSEPTTVFDFKEVSDTEVYEAILKLDSNKGPGPDNFNVKVLKFVANLIAPHLSNILMTV